MTFSITALLIFFFVSDSFSFSGHRFEDVAVELVVVQTVVVVAAAALVDAGVARGVHGTKCDSSCNTRSSGSYPRIK